MKVPFRGKLQIRVVTVWEAKDRFGGIGYGKRSRGEISWQRWLLPAVREVMDLKHEYESIANMNPSASIGKAERIDHLVAWLTETGDRLLACHENWDEAIRRATHKMEPQEEFEIKEIYKAWIGSCDLTLDLIASLMVKKDEVKNATDFLIVQYKVKKVFDNWKTPKPYILPSMRQQVLSGAGADNFKKFLEGSKNQRIA